MSFLTPDLTKESDIDVFAQFDRRETPFGEYFGAKVDEGFDFTTTRMMVDEDQIARAEKEEYGISKSHFWGGGNPYHPITQYSQYRGFQAKRKSIPLMSKEEWETSEFYRQGMEFRDDMTTVRARYMAEAYDKRRYRDSLIQRSPDGLRNVAGFVGQLIGNVPDPINFIPMGLAGKGGTAAVRIGSAMVEGAASTAVADALILPDLAARGEAVGWQDAATDIFFGSLIGGLGGWGGHALHQRRVAKLKNRLLARHREIHARAAEKAMADLAAGEPVDVSAVYRSSEDGMAAIREAEAVANAYDEVKATPLDGQADDVLATIAPGDIDAVLIKRGPAIEKDGEIVVQGGALRKATGSKGGYGLVKIIWKHGEKGAEPEGRRIVRQDVVNLPRKLREYLPAENDSRSVRWRYPADDGRSILVAARHMKDGDAVMTMYVEDVPSGPASQKKRAASPAGGDPARDTHIKTRGKMRADLRNKTIEPQTEGVNWTTGQTDEFSPVELPQDRGGELEALGMDKDGQSPELDAIMGMIERDELDLEDMRAMERVLGEFEQAQRLDDVGLEIIGCILEAAG